jgi:hypothetical protein
VIARMMADRTLIAVVPNAAAAAGLPRSLRFRGGRALLEERASEASRPQAAAE